MGGNDLFEPGFCHEFDVVLVLGIRFFVVGLVCPVLFISNVFDVSGIFLCVLERIPDFVANAASVFVVWGSMDAEIKSFARPG